MHSAQKKALGPNLPAMRPQRNSTQTKAWIWQMRIWLLYLAEDETKKMPSFPVTPHLRRCFVCAKYCFFNQLHPLIQISSCCSSIQRPAHYSLEHIDQPINPSIQTISSATQNLQAPAGSQQQDAWHFCGGPLATATAGLTLQHQGNHSEAEDSH